MKRCSSHAFNGSSAQTAFRCFTSGMVGMRSKVPHFCEVRFRLMHWTAWISEACKRSAMLMNTGHRRATTHTTAVLLLGQQQDKNPANWHPTDHSCGLHPAKKKRTKSFLKDNPAPAREKKKPGAGSQDNRLWGVVQKLICGQV